DVRANRALVDWQDSVSFNGGGYGFGVVGLRHAPHDSVCDLVWGNVTNAASRSSTDGGTLSCACRNRNRDFVGVRALLPAVSDYVWLVDRRRWRRIAVTIRV